MQKETFELVKSSGLLGLLIVLLVAPTLIGMGAFFPKALIAGIILFVIGLLLASPLLYMIFDRLVFKRK